MFSTNGIQALIASLADPNVNQVKETTLKLNDIQLYWLYIANKEHLLLSKEWRIRPGEPFISLHLQKKYKSSESKSEKCIRSFTKIFYFKIITSLNTYILARNGTRKGWKVYYCWIRVYGGRVLDGGFADLCHLNWFATMVFDVPYAYGTYMEDFCNISYC